MIRRDRLASMAQEWAAENLAHPVRIEFTTRGEMRRRLGLRHPNPYNVGGYYEWDLSFERFGEHVVYVRATDRRGRRLPDGYLLNSIIHEMVHGRQAEAIGLEEFQRQYTRQRVTSSEYRRMPFEKEALDESHAAAERFLGSSAWPHNAPGVLWNEWAWPVD